MLGNALVHFVSRRALRTPNVGEETAKLLARALGSLGASVRRYRMCSFTCEKWA